MSETIVKIWDLPHAEAVTATMNDLEAQVRGGRTLARAAVALVKITQRWVPAEHQDKIMTVIFEAVIEVDHSQYVEIN